MRKSLWVVAFLIFVPCVRADSFHVTSGFIQCIGPPPSGATGNTSLSGDGFTATGSILLLGPCLGSVVPGQPVSGINADPGAILGVLTPIMNGVSQPAVHFDGFITIKQAPMFLSGVEQATLTEQVIMFGDLNGCTAPFNDLCGQPPYKNVSFSLAGDVILFTTTLTQNADGGYNVTSAGWTISTPEPGTAVLMLIGIGLVLVMRKRIAKGLPQAT
jgi:PEP-CTERM motif